jgi:hypothetical protein
MIQLIMRLFGNGVKKNTEPESFVLSKKDFDSIVTNWNIKFPLDNWYRRKYNIRFDSDEHRKTPIRSIAFEFQEHLLFEKYEKQDEYKPNEGKFIKRIKVEEKPLTLEDVQKEFEKIDLSQFDDK